MWRTTYFAAIALFLGAVSFVVPSGPAILGWSLVVGITSFLGIRFIDDLMTDVPTEVAAMLVAGGATLCGWAWKLAYGWTGWIDGIGVVVAVGSAWALDALTSISAPKPCFLCKQPSSERPFTCPRCQRTICARPSCWIARHARCRRCHELEVVIFPQKDEQWWQRRVGPRLSVGTCSGAGMEEAYEADLRACGRCGWPFCKRCWDRQNGKCTHCGWVMPGLPKALVPLVGVSDPAPSQAPQRSSRR